MSDLLYRLNAQDRISSVSDEWFAFAEGNEGRALLSPEIVGRPIWDFIGDVETRHLYEVLHGRVRRLGAPARLSFRCDGPEHRRLLQLDIQAGEGQELLYRVRTLKEESRPSVPLLDPRQPRSESFVTMCGWCKRVATLPQGWLEVEDAVAALSLFDEPRPPQITHGVCEECIEELHEVLEDHSASPVLGAL